MSDSDFVDVGDELVVSISGYPVGKAVVKRILEDRVVVNFQHGPSRVNEMNIILPLDFKDYDTVDGVNHGVLG